MILGRFVERKTRNGEYANVPINRNGDNFSTVHIVTTSFFQSGWKTINEPQDFCTELYTDSRFERF
jgi:hypothetical protein